MMESLCRLCGSEDGIKVDIFQPGTERVKKINKILPITINEHDPFPKQICHHCAYKVDQFFEFRTTSIKTQENFKRKVPWLKNKKTDWRKNGEPPMVEVALNSINTISPSEKQVSPSNRTMFEDFTIVIDDDSPPYVEHSNEPSSITSEHVGSEPENRTDTTEARDTMDSKKRKRSKSRSRSMWNTKKRKKKNNKSCRVHENDSATLGEYQKIDAAPLCPSPVDNIESNSLDKIDENNSAAVNSPRPEVNVVEKGILADDKGSGNVAALPKYILVTKLPNMGNIYACEGCSRVFLNPQPATVHKCPSVQATPAEDERSKEEPKHHTIEVATEKRTQEEAAEKNKTKDFYQCNECGDVFMRHSQLVAHEKKHKTQLEEQSSSDDSFRPFNTFKRRKHHMKRKHKKLLNSSSTITNDNQNSDSVLSYNSNWHHESNSPTTKHNHNSNNNIENQKHTSNNSFTNHAYKSNETSTNNNCSPNVIFETAQSNFPPTIDSVETKITRHSLLSSDSE